MRRTGTIVALVLAAWPAAALAHGTGPAAPTPSILVTGWEFDPLLLIGIGLACMLYVAGVRRVNRLHPRARWPRGRTVYFFLGIAVFIFALVSPFASFDDTLFVMHMWQHMLLVMVAAPFLLLGTPATLALRAATPPIRREVLLPILHSAPIRWITFPVVPWVLYTAVMWGSHFSGIYNLSLEHLSIHELEHLAYLVSALLFWWEVIGLDPTPWHMHHAVRLAYVALQIPLTSFLGVAFISSNYVYYSYYLHLGRTWGPSPLLDQQLAGFSMWVGGDMMLLVAMAALLVAWTRADERAAQRIDARLDLTRAQALRSEVIPEQPS